MTILYESPHTGAFLLSLDDDGNLSRDAIVIAAGQGALPPGAVLGKVTASGKYVMRKHGATDGSQTACAILYGRADATRADAKAVSISRHAEVRGSGLIWDSGEAPADKAAGLAQLAAAMIIAR